MISRILVGLGGTAYTENCTRTAIDIAQRHNAQLTGVTVVDLNALRRVGPVPMGAGQAAKELREHRLEVTRDQVEKAIDAFSTACQEAKVQYCVLKEESDQPFDYLVSQSRYHDVTVLGLRGIFEFGVAGSMEDDPSLTLVNLLSGGVRPIVAVPKNYRTVKRVLAAYSGSVESASTLKKFLQLKPMGDIELRVVTFGMTSDRAEHLLADAAKYCRAQGVEPEIQMIAEPPEIGLLGQAQSSDADLIVLGNSAKNILLRRVLGETALKVIRNAEQPLFLSQ